MNLLNQTLNSFSTLIYDEGVSLKLDIFEANLININLLACGLLYLLGGALLENAVERKNGVWRKFLTSILLSDYSQCYVDDARDKLRHLSIILRAIKNESIQNTILVQRMLYRCTTVQADYLRSVAKTRVAIMRGRVRMQMSHYVARAALQRARVELKGELDETYLQEFTTKMIDQLAEEHGG